MRFKGVAFGIALSIMVAGTANAASTWMGFNGGAGIPTGDYGDFASTGWHIGATGTHPVNDTWSFGADLGYHAWNGSQDANDAAEILFGPGSEYSSRAIQATAHTIAKFSSQGQVKPYAKVGAGLYRVSLKLSSPSGDDETTSSKLGFNFGGGFDVATSGNMRWGFDGAYHRINAEDDLGANLSFFTVGVNVMWGVGSN